MAVDIKDKDTVNHNLKEMVTNPESLKYLRKNMGLGDTLGPLPKENGGTGTTGGQVA